MIKETVLKRFLELTSCNTLQFVFAIASPLLIVVVSLIVGYFIFSMFLLKQDKLKNSSSKKNEVDKKSVYHQEACMNKNKKKNNKNKNKKRKRKTNPVSTEVNSKSFSDEKTEDSTGIIILSMLKLMRNLKTYIRVNY